MNTGQTNITLVTTDDYTHAYCADCADSIYSSVDGAELQPLHTWENLDADYPQHCSQCAVLLDWNMTSEGLEYVRLNVVTELTGNTEGLASTDWHAAYGEYVKEALDADTREHLDTLEDVDTVLAAYLETLVWTGSLDYMTNTAEHGGESLTSDNVLDSVCSVSDLPSEVVKSAREDVENFVEQITEWLPYFLNIRDLSAEQLGHDFCLTRNHHGAGFWDRGLGDLGQWLTAIAQSYGSHDVMGAVVLVDASLPAGEVLALDNLNLDTLQVWECN